MPLNRRTPDWELAEILYLRTMLTKPKVVALVQATLGGHLDAQSPVVRVVFEHMFRRAVLDELERHEPQRVKEATAAVCSRYAREEGGDGA